MRRIEAYRGTLPEQSTLSQLPRPPCHDIKDMQTDAWGMHPRRYLDLPRLLSWLSSRQYAPEGGFSGRTNKLVDGCYSHWVGGCWPLIEASLNGPQGAAAAASAGRTQTASEDALFDRNGLIRYILCCCQDQSRRGGLRDKPSKYVLTCFENQRPRTRVNVTHKGMPMRTTLVMCYQV
jgi:hypothetical protein